MQLEAIPTRSIRIKEILAYSSRLKTVKEYCALVDASEEEKTNFRRKFTDIQYKELKLDAKVIKKHLQEIENSGSSWLKYDDTEGFYLIDYF